MRLGTTVGGAEGLPLRLRSALASANYTVDGVRALLGDTAHRALQRNETTPGLRATRDRSPLATLTRLFLLQAPVPLDDAEAALPGLLDQLCTAGLLERSVAEVAARLDCRPYAADGPDGGNDDMWVVSDLTPGLDGAPNRVGSDHVLGISSASTSLAQLTLRHPVRSALDLGTGCGVQALHLAGHADRVVATDVNERALSMAGFNAALNDRAGIELREGSFFEPFETPRPSAPQEPPFETPRPSAPQEPPFETPRPSARQETPVRGERFDLIATNPPFVISPATGERLVYRDSGLPGDRVVEDIVRAAPDRLTEGGWCQILGNWAIARGVPWDERLAGWLPGDAGCDALIVQREVLDTASYVELWLKDAGRHGAADYADRYDTWLSWFDHQGIEAIGFGWLSLRRSGGSTRTFLDWPYDVEQPIAQAVADWSAAQDSLSRTSSDVGVIGPSRDDVLLGARPVARGDVLQETQGAPGAEDPATIVLRQQRGFRRARRADTVEAALVGACDGDLTVGQILDALATLLERDAGDLRTAYLPVVRDLVAEGFLTL